MKTNSFSFIKVQDRFYIKEAPNNISQGALIHLKKICSWDRERYQLWIKASNANKSLLELIGNNG